MNKTRSKKRALSKYKKDEAFCLKLRSSRINRRNDVNKRSILIVGEKSKNKSCKKKEQVPLRDKSAENMQEKECPSGAEKNSGLSAEECRENIYGEMEKARFRKMAAEAFKRCQLSKAQKSSGFNSGDSSDDETFIKGQSPSKNKVAEDEVLHEKPGPSGSQSNSGNSSKNETGEAAGESPEKTDSEGSETELEDDSDSEDNSSYFCDEKRRLAVLYNVLLDRVYKRMLYRL